MLGIHVDIILGNIPLPSRRYAWINLGSNFKNARNMRSCMCVKLLIMFLRITKIYILLCLWCMVKEILVIGQPKVKWGQIFNNVRFTCLRYQIVRLAVYMPKIYGLTQLGHPVLK